MATELRKTGISVVGDIPWGRHFCHFYETKQDLLDTLLPYFKAGLESNEFCVWVVSTLELMTVEEAKRALAQAVPDLDRHLADENIEILNGADWYLEKNAFNLGRVTEAWHAKLKRALARGYDGMRVSGDTFWLAEKISGDFFAYERQLNESITGQNMTLLCTYPLAKSGAAEVLDVVRAHQFAIARRQGEWEVIETPELIQAKAEIKRLNEELEQRVIERTGQLERAIEELRVEISERKQSQVQLSLAHQRLSYHVENTPLAVIEWDKDLFIKRWSKRAEEVFGWKASEALEISMYDRNFPAVHEEDVQAVAEISGQLLKGTVDRNLGLNRNYTKDGNVIYCEWYNSVLRDEHGHVVTILSLVHDVTERKRAEALLHAKEQEFRAIVENAPDQIVRYDREFRRVYLNPAVAETYGLPAEALIGKPIGSVIRDGRLDVKDDELAQLRQRIQAVFDTGRPCEFEITWPSPTGRKHYSSRLFPELDLNGSVINVLGIGRDITESKRAEEELKKEKEVLEKIFDNIPVMIGFVGEDGLVKLVNPEWERTIGWTLKELQNQNLDIFVEAYPDVSYRQEILEFVAASTGESKDLKIKVRDGRVIDAACAVVRLSDGTRVAIAQDITERKQAEGKLLQRERQLAQAQRLAHVGSWEWDLRNNAVTWSDELYHIFGLQPGAIKAAGDVIPFIHPEDRDLVERTVAFSVENKEPYSFHYRIVRPDGEERIIHSRGHVATDDNGNSIRVFGASQDVTEIRSAEERLRETSEQLRALSARVQSAREEEGIRIAREIHDELGGALTSLKVGPGRRR